MQPGVFRVFRNLFAVALLLGAVFCSVVFAGSPDARAVSGVSGQINFQGRLLNAQGATVPDGKYNIQFKIYQDGDGKTAGNTTGSPAGTLKWTESYLNASSQGVTVKNGYMSVQLGSITSFSGVDWNQDTLWLSMNIAGTSTSCTPFSSCSPDGEMLPMKRLSSTPYAMNAGKLGGLSSAQFLQLAQGLQTDATTNSNSIYLNKTSSGNFLALQSNGTDAFMINNSGDIAFGANSDHTISVTTAAAGSVGKTLTIAAGSALNSGAGAAGGSLVLQGGNAAGTGNNDGGDITIAGGASTGSGARGLVNLSASAFTSATNPDCAASCTISQNLVDNYGTIIVNASAADITVTLPAPTRTATAGRILYVTTPSGSKDFNLTANAAGDAVNIGMRQNSTATMIWSGTAWTPGGASNSTTLQAVYNNGTNASVVPEIKLDATHGTIDIQDADTSIGGDILNVRGSNSAGLGTVLFGVSSSGRVTIQDTADQSSSFRVLNSAGNYVFNANSSNGYVFSNTTSTPGNQLANPSFESGGSVTGGEEGWFGPSQANFVNASADAKTGNYSLQVAPNASNIDVFGGSYYEVTPGESYYLSGYVKNSAGANGNAGVQITWYNKDKGVLSYSTDYGGLPGTSYALKKVSAAAPAGAKYARISATVRSTATTGLFYFDDLYFKKNTETADVTYRNAIDSTTAFRIQSAQSAQTLFTANTTNNTLKVGDNLGNDTNTTLLVLDSATANPTTNLLGMDGALFYRSDTNSLKAVVGGAVVDICTTAVTCSGYSASASSTIQLQGSTPGTAQIGNFNITGTGILTQLQTQDKSSASTNSDTLTIRTGNATGSGSNSGNLILDVGTATGTTGSISIGHTGVATTIGGNLAIQGNNSLSLGTGSVANGSILFKTAAGNNTITLKAPDANPSSSYAITLPQNLGIAGDCLKDTGSGVLGFGNCSSGVTVSLQDVYNNSSPANTTLANGKDYVITGQQTTTSPNIRFDLKCTTSCGTNGRFAVQNNGVDIFRVNPNGGGIVLGGNTQVGSNLTDSTQVNFQLDSASNSTDQGGCSNSVNQGAMYYNTSMGSIRACVNGSWGDVSNPETLGLLSFGIVPSSGVGNEAYDLPSLINAGVSGPCKVSWDSNNTLNVQPCVAYSGGRRVAVVNAQKLCINTTNAACGSGQTITLSATNRWAHVCLSGPNGQPAFTSSTGSSSATADLPAFSITEPVVCLADVQGETTNPGRIDNIYDVRTFTSTLKEAVITSSPLELGMLADSNGANGALTPAVSGSKKLYGLVVATDGSTSASAPNVIISTVGAGWVKATAGTAGDFIKTSITNGYADTTGSIPNNSFYYSAGNTRTNYSTTCTASNNCSGSLYVNFIVR